MELDQFVLDHTFNKLTVGEDVVYWRDCVLQPDMNHGEQGYIVVYSDGSHMHTYHYPPNFLG